MAHAVRRRPLIAEARVRHQSNELRFSHTQSGVWSGFSPSMFSSSVILFPWRNSPLWALASPLVRLSRLHSDTPHLVGLLWTGDQPDSDNIYRTTHTTLKTDEYPSPSAGFEHVIPAR